MGSNGGRKTDSDGNNVFRREGQIFTLYLNFLDFRKGPSASDSASEVHVYVGKQVKMFGWLITEKFAETDSGQPMEFTTFEDLTGLYDATFFPKVFQKYGHLLTGGKPYGVKGLVEEDLGECALTVKKLVVVNRVATMAR